MKREFGDLLLTNFIDDNYMPEQLPSPEVVYLLLLLYSMFYVL